MDRSSRSSGSSRLGSLLGASTLFHVLCIMLVGIAAYANTLHVPFQFDDNNQILEKSFVRDINSFFDTEQCRRQQDHGFRMRTIGYLSFALNYRMHGTDVVGYHVVNLAIHIVNSFLVYWLVSLTFRTPHLRGQYEERKKVKIEEKRQTAGMDRSSQPSPTILPPQTSTPALIALFTALLFISHPVQTEAVTYIIQRLTSLATLWYLLGVCAYVRWRVGGSSGLKAAPWYALSLISLVLGMKTKEIVFTAPLVICLYEFMFFKGPLKERMLYIAPLLLTMLIIPVGLMGIKRPLGEVIGDVSEVMKVQTDISRWDYLFTEFRVIVTYLRLLILPMNQNLDYDYPVYHSFSDPNVLLSFLFLVLIFSSGLYLLYRSRKFQPASLNSQSSEVSPAYSILPASCFRLMAFGIFWFFVTLSVESSIIPIADVIFEHRIYLPSVGLFIFAVTMFFLIRERLSPFWQRNLTVIGCIVIIGLSSLTFLRNNIWKSEVSLWEDVVRKSPMKSRPHYNRGMLYEDMGQLDKAVEDYGKAIVANPSYSKAYNNRGIVFNKMGRSDRALADFDMAISTDPNNAQSYVNRGLLYLKTNQPGLSIADFRKACELGIGFGCSMAQYVEKMH